MKNRFLLLFAMLMLGLGFSSPMFAAYTSVSDVVSAVNGVTTTASSTFYTAAEIGVGIITASFVVYVLRRGIKLR